MNIKWVDKDELLVETKKKVKKADIILDIGCGIRPQNIILPSIHICCEPYVGYIDVLRKNINDNYDRNYIIINCQWDKIVEIIPEKSVDTVFLLDVIEHVEKDVALNLLQKTFKLAKKQVIIFTPIGFLPQQNEDNNDGWGLGGGYWQEHKSGWNIDEFKDCDVIACSEYHYLDGKGEKLEHPYGAMWVIKNTYSEVENVNISRRIKAHRLLDNLIDKFNIIRGV